MCGEVFTAPPPALLLRSRGCCVAPALALLGAVIQSTALGLTWSFQLCAMKTSRWELWTVMKIIPGGSDGVQL